MAVSEAATELRCWLDDGRQTGARWMLVSCRLFGNDHYPHYVKPDEDPYRVLNELTARGNTVHEVYDVAGDLDEQLGVAIAWSLPPRLE